MWRRPGQVNSRASSNVSCAAGHRIASFGFVQNRQLAQELAIRLEALDRTFERAAGLREDQRIRSPLALQRVFDVALLPVDDVDQMLASVFAGRNASDLMVFVNPEFVEREGMQLEDEGCLSVPGFNARPTRHFASRICCKVLATSCFDSDST